MSESYEFLRQAMFVQNTKRLMMFCLLSPFVLGCSRSSENQAEATSDTVTVGIFDPNDVSYRYVDGDEARAEIVLVVEIRSPASSNADMHRFPLRHYSKATCARVGRIDLCWRACGTVGFSGGSISVTESDLNTGFIIVSVSTDWQYDNGKSGEFKREVRVPWLGEAIQKIDKESSIRIYFRKPLVSV